MKTKNLLSSYLFFWAILFNFLLITLYACGGVTGSNRVNVNQSQHPTAAHGLWTWVSGDSTFNQRGDYGTKGVAASTNKPGARDGSVSWTDSKDNLWLFGGYGYSATGYSGNLNDLWKYDGTNWTWVSGDSRINQHGVYGAKGVAAGTNKPGARHGSVSWTDSKDNLWFFGGVGYDGKGIQGKLNDLWKFDGTNWIWVSGDSRRNQRGVYGTKGIAAGTNKPGARLDSVSWTDSKDNLWLFGGRGEGKFRESWLNDLWKFDGTNWIWVSGDSQRDQRGDYGTKGVAAGTNKPGARYGGVSWTDSKDNLWLFGGRGEGKLWESLRNDLWKFDGTNWTWVSGDSRRNQIGVYGAKGVAAGTNKPGARNGSVSWTDSKDNLWLFGGWGRGNVREKSLLNDLWIFDGTNWTWVSGDGGWYRPGVYGTKGVAVGTNKPGGRDCGISWIDSKGNLWLFGGRDLYSGNFNLNVLWESDYFNLNDLWKFEP